MEVPSQSPLLVWIFGWHSQTVNFFVSELRNLAGDKIIISPKKESHGLRILTTLQLQCTCLWVQRETTKIHVASCSNCYSVELKQNINLSNSRQVALSCKAFVSCLHLRLYRTWPSGKTLNMMLSVVVSWMKDLLEWTKNTSGTHIFFTRRPSKVMLLFVALGNASLSSFQ